LSPVLAQVEESHAIYDSKESNSLTCCRCESVCFLRRRSNMRDLGEHIFYKGSYSV
jgi:hypothetical protein